MIVGDDMRPSVPQGAGVSKSPDHIASRYFLACIRYFNHHTKITSRRTQRAQQYFEDFPKKALPLDISSERATTKMALDLLQVVPSSRMYTVDHHGTVDILEVRD